MSPAEAEALINEGAGIDAGQAAHQDAAAAGLLDEKGNIIQAAPGPDPVIEKAKEWFLIPKTIAWAISTALPETKEFYTDDACMELAKAFVPVADKYGWDGMGDVPELTLLLAVGGFCAPGYLAFKERKRIAAERAAQAKASGQQSSEYIKPINETQAA